MNYINKVSLALVSSLFLVSCGDGGSNAAKEKAMEDAAAKHGVDADVTLDKDGNPEKVVINSGGAQVGKNLDLPEGFPNDITLPADWDIMASSSPMPNSFNLQAMTPASAEDVTKLLRTNMKKDGWTETAADSPTPQMARIGFEKGNRMANFNIVENGGTRIVQILTMPKP